MNLNARSPGNKRLGCTAQAGDDRGEIAVHRGESAAQDGEGNGNGDLSVLWRSGRQQAADAA